MEITLAVTTWNDEKIIRRFMEHHKPHVDEVVWADDASNDHTVEIAKGYADKCIINPKREHNCEFYRQKLSDLASNDWVLMMDSDQFVDFNVLDKLRDLAIEANKKHIVQYIFDLETIGYIECGACPTTISQQIKFVNRKYIRWSPFPHCGLFYLPGYQEDKKSFSAYAGRIWHLMKVEGCDHEHHRIEHMLRMRRWIDVVRLYMKTYTSEEYSVDRERIIRIFEGIKIPIENTLYDCSKDRTQPNWIEDDVELWKHLHDIGVF